MKTISQYNKGIVCIVIPCYKKDMTPYERISFDRCREAFADFDRYLAVPENLITQGYVSIDPDVKIVRFENKYFESIYAYSLLCKLKYFYEPFLHYDYMLVYQLDCFVFENNLLDWCKRGYDYVGAPWMNPVWLYEKTRHLPIPFLSMFFNNVGNGGFSLRKVKTFYKASKWLHFFAKHLRFHEDIWWTNFANRLYPFIRIPNEVEALLFSFEDEPEKSYEITNHQLPFGCHAWEKYGTDFWRTVFREYGYII